MAAGTAGTADMLMTLTDIERPDMTVLTGYVTLRDLIMMMMMIMSKRNMSPGTRRWNGRGRDLAVLGKGKGKRLCDLPTTTSHQ